MNFTNPSGASTNTDGHWYALPNVSCPPADNPGAPNRISPYTITATLNYPSGNTPVTHTSTLSVDFVWITLARTGQTSITGVPAMAADCSGVWHITGTGSMTRVLPVPNVLVSTSSQFYNKVFQHEQVHVNQWNSGQLFGNLYIVNDLFNIVKNFTGTSQTDLLNQYNTALTNYDNTEVNIFNSQRTTAERQAYAVSDPIAPQYMVQNCGRF